MFVIVQCTCIVIVFYYSVCFCTQKVLNLSKNMLFAVPYSLDAFRTKTLTVLRLPKNQLTDITSSICVLGKLLLTCNDFVSVRLVY